MFKYGQNITKLDLEIVYVLYSHSVTVLQIYGISLRFLANKGPCLLLTSFESDGILVF